MGNTCKKATEEEMREECGARLRLLGFGQGEATAFCLTGRRLYTADMLNGISGRICELSDYPELAKKASELENGHLLVYHAVISGFGGNERWSLLFVSDNRELWEDERRELCQKGLVKVFDYCSGGEDCPGVGTMIVRPGARGGHMRVM